MGVQNKTKNKQIAKNTIFLYCRMFLILIVSLYTSRVVLQTLGEMDFGILNVVGGFITIFAFLGTTMSSAVSRYFAFEIGRGDSYKLNCYFNLSIIAFSIISLIILLLGETIGLWFLHNKMTIPEDRLRAAFWVYQFSVLAFIIQMFVIPYNSLIIAKEKMDIYAYISIFEAIMKLIVVCLLTLGEWDKLIFYSLLLLFSSCLTQALYIIYCKKEYKAESTLRKFWDFSMFSNLISFSGWTLFGAISGMCRGQGLNIIINLFFNPVVNAARGIAFQISSSINQFVNGFYTACRPQITKSYAQNNIEEMLRLVFQSSKLCFFLIFILSMPVIFQIDYILGTWLGNYPTYTPLFTILVIIEAMVESLSYPFQGAVSSTGNIKGYQIVTGGLMILTLPIAYILLEYGFPPESTMIVSICIALMAQISRMFFMRRLLHMSIRKYAIQVLIPVMFVVAIDLLIVYMSNRYIQIDTFFKFVLYSGFIVLLTMVTIYSIGLCKNERMALNGIIKKIHI